MTWDPTWEKVFRERDWGRYPPEELIRFVARHYYGVPDRSAIRILEIGCGTGANLWYLAREGFAAWGIDGSQSAIRATYERIANDDPVPMWGIVKVADATNLAKEFRPRYFDAVIDVCCLQHNRLADQRAILGQAHAVLKPGGRVFSMMVGAGSWGDGLGTELEPGTFTDITEGPAAGLGVTRFVTHREAWELFRSFEGVDISISSRTMNGLRDRWSMWVIEGRKAE